MNRLFRSNFYTSSRSSIPPSILEISQDDGTLNSEEYSILDVDLKLGDWNILKVPTSEIYKSSWSLKRVFKTNYHVNSIDLFYGFNMVIGKSALIYPQLFGIERDIRYLFLMSKTLMKKTSQPKLNLSK